MSCAVKWCRNVKRFKPEGVNFHRFPRGHLLAAWKDVLGFDENWKWTCNKYVCSKHFKPNNYMQMGGRCMLKLGSVPFLENHDKSPKRDDASATHSESTTNTGHSRTRTQHVQQSDASVDGNPNPILQEIVNTNTNCTPSTPLEEPSPLAHVKEGKCPGFKRRKVKVGKVKLKLSTQETEVCMLCLDRSELQSVTTAPLARELNNFNFIEVEIGYKLPERICKECLRKLNDTASFIKMCKDSFYIHTKIEEHQNRNSESDVNEADFTTEHIFTIDSESNELHELSSEIEDQSDVNEKYLTTEHIFTIDSESNELHELTSETGHQNRTSESDVNEEYLTTEHIGSESNEFPELPSETEHQNSNNESDVNEAYLTTEHIGSESSELHELSSETCKPAAPTEDVKENTGADQKTETEVNIPDELQDHVYFKLNKKIIKSKPQKEIKTCPTCFETVPRLITHYKKEPQCRPKNIQCSMCPALFRDRSKLRSHQRAQHPENYPIRSAMCHICSKIFKHGSNLRRHLRVHKHGKQFICEQCGKGYTTAIHLQNHQNSHLSIKPFLCAKCGQQFSKKTSLQHHELKCRRRVVNNDTESEVVVCKICDRKFLGHGLKIHMHTHHEDRKCCQKCNAQFETALLYRQHLKIHSKRDAVCPYCLKSYPRSGIKQHIATHTGDRQFSCPECDRKFRTRVHLATHRLGIHNINRGKPLKCKYCDQVFTLRGNLRVHERIHTGEKPYSCHVCDEVFSDSKKRRKHVSQVHGEDEVENIINMY